MPSDQGRNFERERELIEAHSLDAKIRMFINRWAPEDGPRDFEADLIQIIHTLYREAQAPLVKQMSAAFALRPFELVVMTESNSHRQK